MSLSKLKQIIEEANPEQMDFGLTLHFTSELKTEIRKFGEYIETIKTIPEILEEIKLKEKRIYQLENNVIGLVGIQEVNRLGIEIKALKWTLGVEQ